MHFPLPREVSFINPATDPSFVWRMKNLTEIKAVNCVFPRFLLNLGAFFATMAGENGCRHVPSFHWDVTIMDTKKSDFLPVIVRWAVFLWTIRPPTYSFGQYSLTSWNNVVLVFCMLSTLTWRKTECGTWLAISAFILSPGQTIATFQCNISQHCCIMLRHVAEGLAKRTQHHATVYTIVSANIYGPWSPVVPVVNNVEYVH